MREPFISVKRYSIGLLVVIGGIGLAMAISPLSISGRGSDGEIIAEGAGTTLIHGGTGAPSFTPVITTIAFHAERTGSGVTGSFDCLALMPEANTGSQSGQFTVNAMNVVGQVTGLTVSGNTASLTGISTITGLGAGSHVTFTFLVRGGGPG